jgi:hypothetical protein
LPGGLAGLGGHELGAAVGGPREAIVELAGAAPGIERLALRPATLEDAHCARTLTGLLFDPEQRFVGSRRGNGKR